MICEECGHDADDHDDYGCFAINEDLTECDCDKTYDQVEGFEDDEDI